MSQDSSRLCTPLLIQQNVDLLDLFTSPPLLYFFPPKPALLGKEGLRPLLNTPPDGGGRDYTTYIE